jgi:hypothetical protein
MTTAGVWFAMPGGWGLSTIDPQSGIQKTPEDINQEGKERYGSQL